MSYYVIVATAGHDTTSSSTAGAIWGLCENPGELAKLKAGNRLKRVGPNKGGQWEVLP
jgi:cytochrome P450